MTKTSKINVPTTLKEAEIFLAELGKAQRERDKFRLALNDKIAELKQKYEEAAAPAAQRIAELVDGLYVFAEKHKADILPTGKTVALETGHIGWRTTPPKVSLRNQHAVLERIKAMGLNQFLRIKEEINKEAMLQEPEIAVGIPGVSITQTEQFWVKPAATDLEEIAG